ncbi:hypothetical protein HYV73_02875 [Candidatus Uhrbacteria bacterium]|nr:hypothetical protein [Candidatus Uhrbacteria bacterium]
MHSPPFHKIIGHERVIEVLTRLFDSGRVPHAFLFVGADHSGRRTFIQACLERLKGEVVSEHDPNLMWLKREMNEKTGKRKVAIGVEQVRALNERLSMGGLGGGVKMAVIEEADRLLGAAANAILKTLEEPRGNTVFFLRAHALSDVMPTIRSRCMILRLSTVPRLTIQEALVRRGVSPRDAAEAAAASFGCPGAAIRFLEDGELRARLATASGQLSTLLRSETAERLAQVGTMLPTKEGDARKEALALLDGWEAGLRDALLQSLGLTQIQSAQVDVPEQPIRFWLEALRRVRTLRVGLDQQAHPLLTLEEVVMEW